MGLAGKHFYDGPGGRLVHREPARDDRISPQVKEKRYDVVTIGGWSMAVAGIPTGAPRWGVETVNEFYGEKNHIFYRYLTAAQVGRVRVSWGRGDTETHFAIAAILTGTRGLIPEYVAVWWNRAVPESILAARSIGNSGGGAITLTLKIGTI